MSTNVESVAQNILVREPSKKIFKLPYHRKKKNLQIFACFVDAFFELAEICVLLRKIACLRKKLKVSGETLFNFIMSIFSSTGHLFHKYMKYNSFLTYACSTQMQRDFFLYVQLAFFTESL